MNDVEKYFTAEKYFCLFGVLFGLISLALAWHFLRNLEQDFYKGMAYVFLILGLFFVMVCGSVFLRSSRDITRVNSMLQHSISRIQTEELPRMEKVMRNFGVIIVVEIILILTGLLFLLFINTSPGARGVFSGLIIQASFLLIFDMTAQQRGKAYLEFLHSIIHP